MMESDFVPGKYVVLKTEYRTEAEPTLWKIDGSSLLQKFLPFKERGKTLYKNTFCYLGWSSEKWDEYYLAPVIVKRQQSNEIIVEFLQDRVGHISASDSVQVERPTIPPSRRNTESVAMQAREYAPLTRREFGPNEE